MDAGIGGADADGVDPDCLWCQFLAGAIGDRLHRALGGFLNAVDKPEYVDLGGPLQSSRLKVDQFASPADGAGIVDEARHFPKSLVALREETEHVVPFADITANGNGADALGLAGGDDLCGCCVIREIVDANIVSL